MGQMMFDLGDRPILDILRPLQIKKEPHPFGRGGSKTNKEKTLFNR